MARISLSINVFKEVMKLATAWFEAEMVGRTNEIVWRRLLISTQEVMFDEQPYI